MNYEIQNTLDMRTQAAVNKLELHMRSNLTPTNVEDLFTFNEFSIYIVSFESFEDGKMIVDTLYVLNEDTGNIFEAMEGVEFPHTKFRTVAKILHGQKNLF